MESRTDRVIRRALRDGLPRPQRWLWLPFRNSLLSGAQFDQDDATRMRKAVWALSALSILLGSGVVGNWNDGPWVFGLIAFVATLAFLAACGNVSLLGQRRYSATICMRRARQSRLSRDRLIHGNPFTADNGEPRLLYSGKHGRKDWTEELMQQFSDDAATLGSDAGRLLHGGRYEQWKRNSGK